jgi:hypothetical protein
MLSPYLDNTISVLLQYLFFCHIYSHAAFGKAYDSTEDQFFYIYSFAAFGKAYDSTEDQFFWNYKIVLHPAQDDDSLNRTSLPEFSSHAVSKNACFSLRLTWSKAE